MVEFEPVAALAAGLVATLIMTAMMAMSRAAGMTDMPPMPLVMGSMMSGDRRTATVLGSIAHYIMMGTVVFGLGYAALFVAFDDASWWVGALIGTVHGIVVGAMFMPMMPAMHPRMATDTAHVHTTVGADERGQVQVLAPGVLGRNWGAMTPLGMIAGHAVYGLALAVIYQALV